MSYKPLPKTRRKAALRDRALAYAEGRVRRAEGRDSPVNLVSYAFEDGYRAAMSDLRAVIAEQSDELPHALMRVLRFAQPLK